MKTNATITYEEYANNYYRSVNSFISSRRKENIFELLRFYLDIDIYDSQFKNDYIALFNSYDDRLEKDYSNINDVLDEQHNFVIEHLLNHISTLKLPQPSEIVFSGRGYYIYWDIKNKNEPTTEYQKQMYETYYGVPKFLVNSYELVEKQLVELFTYFGSDPKATDVSRLLRDEDTVNQKSFLMANSVFKNDFKYLFEEIADVVLPFTYEEVKVFKTSSQGITSNQRNNLLDPRNINLIKDIDIDCLTRAEAYELINSSVKNKNNKVYKYDNRKYIVKYLDKALKLNYVKEGNRNSFYYYYAIGIKRMYDNEDDINIEAIIYKLNKKIGLDQNEAFNSFKSGLKSKTCNISKKQLATALGLSNEQIIRINKPKRNRTSRNKVKKVYLLMKVNWRIDKNLSIKSLVKKYELSQGSIQKIKKVIKEQFNDINDIKIKRIVSTKEGIKDSVHKKIKKSTKCSSCGGLSHRVDII